MRPLKYSRKRKNAVVIPPGIAFLAIMLIACGCGSGGNDSINRGDHNTYTISGTVSGLSGGGLELSNNASDTLLINDNGPFTFSEQLSNKSDYSVSVVSSPTLPHQRCVVANGNGTTAGSDIDNIEVTCTFSVLSQLQGGSTQKVVVSGAVAYSAALHGLLILDISDPTSPNRLAFFRISSDLVWDVAISGDYAYVVGGSLNPNTGSSSNLHVINVSDPGNPVEVASFNMTGDNHGIALEGTYAYIADTAHSLHIIDISNPAAPIAVGEYTTGTKPRDVVVRNGFAYVAAEAGGLRVVDISDPTAPIEVGFYNTPGSAESVSLAGDYAFVADGDHGLRIIDISDPTTPSEIGYDDTPGTALDINVNSNYAYIADDTGGLRIIDISTPTSPVETGYYGAISYTKGVSVNGAYAYLAENSSGIRVVDISDATAPSEVGFYASVDSATYVAVSGNYAYFTIGETGLAVADISNPNNPVQIGFINTPGKTQRIALNGDYVYLADGDSGLRIIDVTNPALPREAGFYDTPGFASDVAIRGDLPPVSIQGTAAFNGTYAYVADGSSGLRVIDVTDPMLPSEVGSYVFDPLDEAIGISTAGAYAYVASGTGLRIFDIIAPDSPMEIGFYATSRPASGVTVLGNYAYVAVRGFGPGPVNVVSDLRIVDISDPATLVETGVYSTLNIITDVAVYNNHAYLAEENGMQVIDITDLSAPVEMGLYNSGKVGGITISGDHIFVANYGVGLEIF